GATAGGNVPLGDGLLARGGSGLGGVAPLLLPQLRVRRVPDARGGAGALEEVGPANSDLCQQAHGLEGPVLVLREQLDDGQGVVLNRGVGHVLSSNGVRRKISGWMWGL